MATTTDEAEQSPADAQAAESAAMFDLLLTQASRGVWRRAFPVRATLAAARSVAADPGKAVRGSARLAGELADVLSNRSELSPAKSDRRFADPAWSQNPALQRLMQSYLALSTAARAAVDDLELSARDRHQLRFAVDLACDALAPTNSPVLNPLFWKAVIDTGGGNVSTGARNLLRDVASSPRVPTMVDNDAFRVGENVAATDGAVVLRTEQFELLQYTPTTAQVNRTPLLLVPALINKYYLADLSPGRSLVEFLVAGGQPVFVVSWRNPDVRHRRWGMDTYADALDAAVAATRAIARSKRVHLLSLCSGATLTAMWAATTPNQQQLASFAMGVAVLDQGSDSMVNSLADPAAARLAVRASKAKGYLDGASLAETFAWLRPNDLIWNYWVNNYVQGRKPPAFDILFWNADTTRMTAQLHADFIDLFSANQLAEPGAATLRGRPVDLRSVEVDSYVLAGESDHLSAWPSCYQSAQLLGGRPRFVLSSSGHVACIVNPPGNRKASYRVSDGGALDEAPQAWRESTEPRPGTWWEDYLAWLTERNDGVRRAPAKLGNAKYPILDDAPGTYVFDQ